MVEACNIPDVPIDEDDYRSATEGDDFNATTERLPRSAQHQYG